MNTLGHIADRSMTNVLKLKESLPSSIWLLFNLIHKIRLIWYTRQSVKQNGTTQTLLNFAAGQVLESILSRYKIIRIVPYFYVLKKRVDACKETLGKIKFTWNKLLHYSRGKYFEKEQFVEGEQLYDYPFLLEKGVSVSLSYYYQTASKSSSVVKELLQLLTLLSVQLIDLTVFACRNPLNPDEDVGLTEIFVEENVLGQLYALLQSQIKQDAAETQALFAGISTIHPDFTVTFELFNQLASKLYGALDNVHTIETFGANIANYGSTLIGWGNREVSVVTAC